MNIYIIERRYDNPTSGWTTWLPCFGRGPFEHLGEAIREAKRLTCGREQYQPAEYTRR